MPEDTQPTTQAISDELAAIYLRDRDTPCPSCNYNRRDGTTSTCPECGEWFGLISVNQSGRSREYPFVRSLLLLLFIFALLELFYNSLTLINWMIIYGPASFIQIQIEYLAPQLINFVAWIILLFVIRRRRKALRLGTPMSTKKLIVPIAAILGLIEAVRLTAIFFMYFL